MTTFIRISLFILLVVFVSQAIAAGPKSVNTVVVLDLSDRLLIAGQAEKDRAVILAVFDVFEASVRKQLFIKSRDVFSVVILPQRDSKLRTEYYETLLRLDMSKLTIAEKNRKCMAFKTSLAGILNSLYAEAGKGKQSAEYFGVDIWQFFNQSVNDYLLPHATNKVILLTDGYLDFENDAHTVHTRNRFTSSRFMTGLSGINWKQTAEKRDLGFYPVQNKLRPFELTVAGLYAKYPGQAELDKLKYFWNKWLIENQLRNFHLVANMNAVQLSSTIKDLL